MGAVKHQSSSRRLTSRREEKLCFRLTISPSATLPHGKWQLCNLATLSTEQQATWQVEMRRSSGDVPLRVALVIRQQVAKKRLAASSNVPRWQPTNEVKHQAPLMMSPTHRLGVKIVAAFGQLIATRHWANKLIRGKSSVQAQQRETTRDNERQRDSLTL